MTEQESQTNILQMVTEFYLDSGDFNGLPVYRTLESSQLSRDKCKQLLFNLIGERKIDLIFGSMQTNPHIRAFDALEPNEQIQHISDNDELENTCIYPTAKHLSQVVPSNAYIDRPFTRDLALGRPQLAFDAFDINVLEIYRNDPRYWYRTHDRGGSISVLDGCSSDDHMHEGDKVLLQSFGFGFNEDLERAVVVFIRYLSSLSSEHQAIWKARRLNGEYKMHPDYYRPSFLGQFPEKLSLFEAFLLEICEINTICDLIGSPPLFRETWKDNRPRGFGWIVRPTTNEFENFILLLDKMLSDNINKQFFVGDLEIESETTRKDGKIEVRPKGTLQLWKEWLDKNFVTDDRDAIDTMLRTLKDIRKMRQKPAHAVEPDCFDKGIFEKQRKLMMRAYSAIRIIRLILQNHPYAQGHKIRADLEMGKVCNF